MDYAGRTNQGRFVLEIRKGKLLHEGHGKKIYATQENDKMILHFKDDIPPWIKSKSKTIKGKGNINAAVCETLLKFLNSYHVATHYLELIKPGELLVQALDMIPIQVQIWNFASGSLIKRFHLKKGAPLEFPILEYYLKDQLLGNPMVNEDHAYSLGYASPEAMKAIDMMARKVNAVLKSYFHRRRLTLVELNLEFGRVKDQIILGDDISLDNCRLWDLEADQKEQDRFFQKAENLGEDYKILEERICS